MGNTDIEDVSAFALEPHPGYFPDGEEPYVTPAWAKPKTNCRRSRFLVISVFLACILGGAYIHRRATRQAPEVYRYSNVDLSTVAPSVIPPDVQIKECFEWGAKNTSWWATAASATAQFPLNTDSMFFLREGTAINGAFSVFIDNSGKYADGNVHAELSISSRYETFVDQTQVCHSTKVGGGDGLVIKADYEHAWLDNTSIEIKVYIPVPVSGEGLKIQRFETNLPYLRQVIYSSKPLSFGDLTMRGQGQDVDAALVIADTVDMRTSDALVGGMFETTGPISLITKNGMVSGVFNTSSSVTLVTSNAPITARVHLSNDENTGKDAELMMQTTNGDIEGIISLTSLSADGFGGSFDVSAVTSNAANNLIFHSISPRAKLDLISHTSNHDAVVEMEPAFEGGFILETTSIKDAKVVFPPYEEKDPEGRGRKRAAFMVGYETNLTGRAWWDEDGKDLGRSSVEIKSTNAKVLLKL